MSRGGEIPFTGLEYLVTAAELRCDFFLIMGGATRGGVAKF